MIYKALIILVLIAGIAGGTAYYAYELFIKPEEALKEERRRGPPPPPPDPTLPEYQKVLEIEKQGDQLAARSAYESFIANYPHSSKIDEARDRLGAINMALFMSPQNAPDKQVYNVRPGDVLNKVARITKTPPELLMRANKMTGTMLRIGQQIYYTPAEFSLVISRKDEKVTLLNRGRYFKQYRATSMPGAASTKKAATPAATQKLQGKVTNKIAWAPDGTRVIFTDKEFADATHTISVSIPGYGLYSEVDPDSGLKSNKPAGGGIGLKPEDAAELAILLTKGAPVTVE